MKNSSILLMATLGIIFQANAQNTNLDAKPDTTQTGALIERNQTPATDTSFSELEQGLNNINAEKNDTTKIRVGKLKIDVIEDGKDVIIHKDKEAESSWDDWDKWDKNNDNNSFHVKFNKNFKPHWAGFAMGVNSYLTPEFSSTLPDSLKYLDVNTNKSYEVSLNIAQLGIPLVKHRIGIVTGLGFKWNNYKFRNTNVVLKADSTVLYYEIDNTENYSKSKLTVSYITVPILLEFQIPINKKPLYFATGIEGSIKLGSHTKMKTTAGKKTKDKRDFFVSPFSATLTARLGYDWFGIYGSYNIQQLFKNNEGPELYPFAAGLTINF